MVTQDRDLEPLLGHGDAPCGPALSVERMLVVVPPEGESIGKQQIACLRSLYTDADING